ncbi:hypothetical protein D3C71_2057540 [compost metagenome]
MLYPLQILHHRKAGNRVVVDIGDKGIGCSGFTGVFIPELFHIGGIEADVLVELMRKTSH